VVVLAGDGAEWKGRMGEAGCVGGQCLSSGAVGRCRMVSVSALWRVEEKRMR